MNEHAHHHFANVAAIVVPLTSWLTNAPLILSVITGTLGVIYYCLLIAKELRVRRKDKDGKAS